MINSGKELLKYVHYYKLYVCIFYDIQTTKFFCLYQNRHASRPADFTLGKECIQRRLGPMVVWFWSGVYFFKKVIISGGT